MNVFNVIKKSLDGRKDNTIQMSNTELLDQGRVVIDVKGGANNIFFDSQEETLANEVLRPFPEKQINKVVIRCYGNRNKVSIGRSLNVEGVLIIHIVGDDNIVDISNKIFVKRNLGIYILPGGPGIKIHGCQIRIAQENWFNGNVVLNAGESNTEISIGKYCLFADQITMQTSDNHSIFDIDTLQILNKPGNVVVGNHVWVCQNVKFLNHSKIGNNCVVGVNSLVNKIFNVNTALIAGTPARIIRERICWTQNLYENPTDVGLLALKENIVT